MVQLCEIVCAVIALCGSMSVTTFAIVVLVCEFIRTACSIVTRAIEK